MPSHNSSQTIHRQNSQDEKTIIERGQKWVFMATFMNYAMAHWTRKSYTNVKLSLVSAGVDPLTLAAMDSGFMFTYALGSFITGQLGDHFSPVLVVGIGLLGSTICLMLIVYGASSWVVKSTAVCSTWFLSSQLIHGLFQATGGPVNTAIMGNWYPAKGRGLMFGMWTCHQYVGDITAALVSAWILNLGLDWRWCLVVPALANALWAVLILLTLPGSPDDVGVANQETSDNNGGGDTVAIGFTRALLLPSVIPYALAFGFFKLVNYAMFFQLPMILTSHFSQSTANTISALYSIGMMPGGVACGWLSDLYGGRRACVIATFMLTLCPLLLLLALYMDNMPASLLLILLAVMGCMVGGPNNIITSAVAADLSEDPSIRGSRKALGTVTGIINGAGSVTAAIGQMAIPVLASYGRDRGEGYRYVWLFLIVCTIAGTSLMGGRIHGELKGTLRTGERTPIVSTNREGYMAVNTEEGPSSQL